MKAHPCEIEMRLIMSSDSVIDHLQLLRCGHCQSCHILNALRDGLDVLVLVVLQPSTLADPIVGHLQLSRFVVLHGGTTELQINGRDERDVYDEC